jgi:hypothetical protein
MPGSEHSHNGQSFSRRRLPHWGWWLAGGLLAFVGFVGVFIAWPCYRIQQIAEQIEKQPSLLSPHTLSILSVERAGWLSGLPENRPYFIPLIDRAWNLSTYEYSVSDEELKAISTMSDLEKLQIDCTRASPAGMRNLARLTRLQDLHLDSAKPISGAHLLALSALPELARLSLSGAGITDETLQGLPPECHLEWLQLTDAAVTGKGLSKVTALSGLTMFYSQRSPIDAAGLEDIAKINSLETLTLIRSRLKQLDLEALRIMTNLQDIGISDRAFVLNPLPFLNENVRLRRIDLSQGEDSLNPILDRDVELLVRHRELRSVELDGSDISDRTVAILATLPQIEFLGLAHTATTSGSLDLLKGMKSLKCVRLEWLWERGVRPRETKKLTEFFAARPDVERVHFVPFLDPVDSMGP